MVQQTTMLERALPPLQRQRRRVSSVINTVAVSLMTLFFLFIGVAWWAGNQSTSLAWVIGQAQRWLPANTQLTMSDSHASVLQGGTIGFLRWQSPDLTIEISQLHARWDWTALLDNHVLLEQLHAEIVHVVTPTSQDNAAPSPLTAFAWPLHVTAPLKIDTLTLETQANSATNAQANLQQVATPLQIGNIRAQYRFDGNEHRVQLLELNFAQGRYSGNATVQATAPLALQANARADVSTTVPGTVTPVHLQATAQLQGWLGDADIPWEVSAQLRSTAAPHTFAVTEQSTTTATPPVDALQTDIQALLLPWSQQPWGQVQATLRNLNTADWWPGAPTTALSGTIHARPLSTKQPKTAEQKAASTIGPPTLPNTATATTASNYPVALDIQANLDNATPGPWDTAHLPIAQVQVQGRLDGMNWTLAPSSIKIATPSSPAGRIQMQGQYDIGTGHAQAKITLEQVLPTALHTALRASAVSGHIQAQTLVSTASSMATANSPKKNPYDTTASKLKTALPISFDIDVQAATGSPTVTSNPLQIEKIQTKGQWHGQNASGTLQLQDLHIRALQVQLMSHQLRWAGVLDDVALWDARGDMQWTAPGLTAKFDGHINRSSGQGDMTVRLQKPDATQRWLLDVQKQIALVFKDLPKWIPPVLTHSSVRGNASLEAHWRGGWQSMVQALNTPNASTSPVSLQATLDVPQWRMVAITPTTPDNSAAPTTSLLPPLQLQGVRLTLNATPRHLSSSIVGKITISPEGETHPRDAASHIQVQSGITAEQTQPGLWRGRMEATDIHLQLPIAGQQPTWRIKLPQATTIQAQWSALTNDTHVKLVRAELGSGQLQATMIGSANHRPVTVQWQPVRWHDNANSAPTKATNPSTPAQWSTQGSLQGLPLIWLDALGLPAPEKNTAAGDAPSSTDAIPNSRLAQWGIGGDVLFDGQWNVSMGDTLSASASIRRASGDLRLYYGAIANLPASLKAAYNGSPAGIENAEASVTLQDNNLQAQLQWRSAQAGQVSAQIQTKTNIQQRLAALTRQPGISQPSTPSTPGTKTATRITSTDAAEQLWWDSNAPVTGSINAQLPDIGIWSALAPPGWRVRGTMVTQLRLSGTFRNPQWQGDISADDLAVRSVADGLDLQGGKLRVSLEGSQLTINTLELRGGPGSSLRIFGSSGNRTAPKKDGGILKGAGTVQWGAGSSGASGIQMQLTVQAEQLKVLVRADRQASVSGDLQLQLQQGQFKLRGDLNVDRASILLPDETAPTLGNDVVVRSSRSHPMAQDQPSVAVKTSSARSQATPTQTPHIAINLHLGDDFALQGHGITTRLAGQLRIQSSPTHPTPEVTGEIKTVQGRYRAWGQLLDIETGLARFNGAYDNPSLDILALRAQSSERVGVQINGTAQRPRVRLYSNPVRPDAEVLSLLVLGRTNAAGGLQANLLQQAAMALLGGQTSNTSAPIANRLGLDEIGLVGLGSGDDANSAALSVGKRLTKDLYVTYEQSLTSTLGTLYIFYELSRKLTLRGQTGSKDAVDIVYTMQYD